MSLATAAPRSPLFPQVSAPGGAERLARALVLVILYAAPALVCLHGAAIGDGDVWWHLRAAEWMLAHRRFPRTDPFSSFGLATGKPWAAYSWLFELLLLKLYQRWDLVGVLGYSTGMVLAITVAVHRLIARLQKDFTVAVLLTMAVMIAISPLYTPRPWLVTVLLSVLEMDLLLTARRTGNARGLVWLPVLFAVWANVHIQWADGLVVLGVAAVEATLARWWPLHGKRLPAGMMWVLLIACGMAVMVNPYGWRIYGVAWELASQTGVVRYVSELQAIPFRGFHDYLVLAMALCAAGMLGWGRRLPVLETGLLTAAAVVSFRSQRDVWLMAIVAAVVLAQGIGGKKSFERERQSVPWLVVAVSGLVVLAGGLMLKVSDAGLRSNLAMQMPVKAVEFVKAKGYYGKLYNTYEWGGYLMWTLREPVSLDGRAAFHGDERIQRAMNAWFAEPSWASDPDFQAASVVIAPVKLPLAQLLRLDADFELVYEDTVATVFVRREALACGPTSGCYGLVGAALRSLLVMRMAKAMEWKPSRVVLSRP